MLPKTKKPSAALRQANKAKGAKAATPKSPRKIVRAAPRRLGKATVRGPSPVKSDADLGRAEAIKALIERDDSAAVRFVTHRALKPSPLNPRKAPMRPEELAALAANIAVNGILQDLIVRPVGEARRASAIQYEIAMGARRHAAVGLAIADGRLPRDFKLPVKVRRLSDIEFIELAAADNIGREDMHPMDEAEAIEARRRLGKIRDPDLASRLGLPLRTFYRRVALLHLEPFDRALFRGGAFSLDQALRMADAARAAKEPKLPGAEDDRVERAIARNHPDRPARDAKNRNDIEVVDRAEPPTRDMFPSPVPTDPGTASAARAAATPAPSPVPPRDGAGAGAMRAVNGGRFVIRAEGAPGAGKSRALDLARKALIGAGYRIGPVAEHAIMVAWGALAS